MESLRGKLLVASPALLDPNFARTVVLIAEHTDAGALGVVLNRPSEQTVAEMVPALEELVGGDDMLYIGGPVEQAGVLLLAEFADPSQSARIVLEDIGFLVTAEDGGAHPAPTTDRIRIYAGHAGWGSGQLEQELESDDWIVEAATREDIFEAAAEQLWGAVLERKGGQYALLARMPPDPSVN